MTTYHIAEFAHDGTDWPAISSAYEVGPDHDEIARAHRAAETSALDRLRDDLAGTALVTIAKLADCAATYSAHLPCPAIRPCYPGRCTVAEEYHGRVVMLADHLHEATTYRPVYLLANVEPHLLPEHRERPRYEVVHRDMGGRYFWPDEPYPADDGDTP